MVEKKSKFNSVKSTVAFVFEANLWLMADKLRNNMGAADYKHVVLSDYLRLTR